MGTRHYQVRHYSAGRRAVGLIFAGGRLGAGSESDRGTVRALYPPAITERRCRLTQARNASSSPHFKVRSRGVSSLLAGVLFRSFAGLGLTASGSGLTEAQLLQPGRLASV